LPLDTHAQNDPVAVDEFIGAEEDEEAKED
jgi:hypothetical protein